MKTIKVAHELAEKTLTILASQKNNAAYYGWFEVIDEDSEKLAEAENSETETVRKKSGKSKRLQWRR